MQNFTQQWWHCLISIELLVLCSFEKDDLGALYYVVAVILIYGCSIVMMIASYIRKNKDDRRLKRCLKEMAFVRKRELHMSLMWAATKAAALRRNAITPGGQAEESSDLTGPAREPGQSESSDTSGLREPTVWVKKTSEDLNSREIPLEEVPQVAVPLSLDRLRSEIGTSTLKSTSGLGRRSLDCQMFFRPSLEVLPRRASTQLTVPQMTLPKLLLTVPNIDAKGNAAHGSAHEVPEHQSERKQSCPSLQVISILWPENITQQHSTKLLISHHCSC